MLGAALIGHQVIQMCEPSQKRLLVSFCLSVGSVAIASGKCLLLPGDHIIPNNLTMPWLLPIFAHHTGSQGLHHPEHFRGSRPFSKSVRTGADLDMGIRVN